MKHSGKMSQKQTPQKWKWIRPGILTTGKSSKLLAEEISRSISSTILVTSGQYPNRKEYSFGVILESSLTQTMVDYNVLIELIKIYTFNKTAHRFFPNSIHLSPSKSHILVNIVESDINRSRNYFARRAADIANIPQNIVWTATNISVAFNVGAVHLGGQWDTPTLHVESDTTVLLLQLLTIIFTNEKACPIIVESVREGVTSFKLVPVDVSEAMVLFSSLYEALLIQHEYIVLPEKIVTEEEVIAGDDVITAEVSEL